MLIELFGKNFGPFRDEFRLSMLATDIDADSPRGIVEVPVEGDDEPLRLLRCVGIYGPNASGKSSVLLAAATLRYLLANSVAFMSEDMILPYRPFGLDERTANEPVRLGLRAVVEMRVYEYVVEFDREQFFLEKLTELGPSDEEILFERHGQQVLGEWTLASQFRLLADTFRRNALLLSLADRIAPALARGMAVGFERLLAFQDFGEYGHPRVETSGVARRAHEDGAGFGSWLLDWIREADVGIVDYRARPVTRMPKPGEDEEEPSSHRHPGLEYGLSLVHAGSQGPVRFSLVQESVGTLRMIKLAPRIYDLTHGDETRAYFIDEIGASVHPVLLGQVIRQFNCETPASDVRGQLIFASHETSLLDAEARFAPLRRDQVYFTEKDGTGASRLYSVSEFKERNNLNLRRRYLQGRYGALPSPGRLGG